MNMHDEESAVVLRYVQGELAGQELADFSRHLETCLECKEHVEEELALSELFRRTSPLYTAPAELHDRISELVAAAATGSAVPREQKGKIAGILHWRGWRLDSWRVLSLAAATIVITVGVTISLGIFREIGAENYVQAAVVAHRETLDGTIPLDVQSDSPMVVGAWVEQRVPFHFRMPVSQLGPKDRVTYHLAGARLIAYHQHPAVVIAYRMQSQLVSLMVVPGHAAMVAGGDEVRDGALLFHYRNEKGFNVITWENHGLSYALVSSVSGPAQQSCLVCHALNPVR